VGLGCTVDVLGGLDLNTENVVFMSEPMTDNGLGTHELHVLAISEEVWPGLSLGLFCGGIGGLDLACSSLGEAEVAVVV
jgi:hypothetical protein